jgi:hypothetical protein
MNEPKPTNPKDAIGSDKLPLHLWPATASILGCLGLLDGACKYGRSNFRAIGVRASIYVDAAKRHIDAWMEGEDDDLDSGVHHLGHALASLAILVEAIAKGNLTDDRNYPTEHRAWVERYTPMVKKIKARYAGRTVKHYTIQDQPEPAQLPKHKPCTDGLPNWAPNSAPSMGHMFEDPCIGGNSCPRDSCG